MTAAVVSIKTYVLIFLSLLVLTGATFTISSVDTGRPQCRRGAGDCRGQGATCGSVLYAFTLEPLIDASRSCGRPLLVGNHDGPYAGRVSDSGLVNLPLSPRQSKNRDEPTTSKRSYKE